MENQQALQVTHGGNPIDETGLCLLSLDGGGVRGLSTLYVLKNIMDRVNNLRRERGQPKLKPCELFDLIGGTSTGGLIAIMLGHLEMDVDTCIEKYKELMEKVFTHPSGMPITMKGNIRSRYQSERLQAAVEQVIADNGLSGTARFEDETRRGCRTFVCATCKQTGTVMRLRDYTLPDESLINVNATIVEAALATSAATSFFDPVHCDGLDFVDGALGANNPVDEVEQEASNIWSADGGEIKPLVKCLLSIGTGDPGLNPIRDNVFRFFTDTLKNMATQTRVTAQNFIARWAGMYEAGRYFRFDVDQGLADVGLAEFGKEGEIKAATLLYLQHQARRSEVKHCAQNLSLKQNKTPADFHALFRAYESRMTAAVLSSHLSISRTQKANCERIVKAVHETADSILRNAVPESQCYEAKRLRARVEDAAILMEWATGRPLFARSITQNYVEHLLQVQELIKTSKVLLEAYGIFTDDDITETARTALHTQANQVGLLADLLRLDIEKAAINDALCLTGPMIELSFRTDMPQNADLPSVSGVMSSAWAAISTNDQYRVVTVLQDLQQQILPTSPPSTLSSGLDAGIGRVLPERAFGTRDDSRSPAPLLDSTPPASSELSVDGSSSDLQHPDALQSCLSVVASVRQMRREGDYRLQNKFECLSNYFPEGYTIDHEWGPSLFIYSRTKTKTRNRDLERYVIHFVQTPRHWRWIVLNFCHRTSNTRTSWNTNTSTHWARSMIPPGVNGRMVDISDGARRGIEAYLRSLQPGDEDAEVAVTLNSPVGPRVSADKPNHPTVRTEVPVQIQISCEELEEDMGVVEEIDTPVFPEKEIVTRKRYWFNCTTVLVGKERCFHRLFPSPASRSPGAHERFMTELRALACVARSGSPIVPLGGVVADDKRRSIKGYLLKAPPRGLRDITDEINPGTPWARREHWARCIVEAVADLHRMNCSIGFLNLSCFMLDDHDIPQLFLPNAAIYRCTNADGEMPPEFRSGLALREECPEPQSTCNKQADLFRLGMILWLLGNSEAVPVSSHFCQRTSCTARPRCRCTAEHVNPVELPACLGSEIPIYYQGLIMTCRNRRPRDRRTARYLLKHFPSALELHEKAVEAAKNQEHVDNSQYPAGFSMWCDEGGELITEGGFRCDVCNSGNFDLCRQCASKGAHCREDSHTLYWEEYHEGKLVRTTRYPPIPPKITAPMRSALINRLSAQNPRLLAIKRARKSYSW